MSATAAVRGEERSGAGRRRGPRWRCAGASPRALLALCSLVANGQRPVAHTFRRDEAHVFGFANGRAPCSVGLQPAPSVALHLPVVAIAVAALRRRRDELVARIDTAALRVVAPLLAGLRRRMVVPHRHPRSDAEKQAMRDVGGKAHGLIVWSSSRLGNHDLFTMSTDGSNVRPITKGDNVGEYTEADVPELGEYEETIEDPVEDVDSSHAPQNNKNGLHRGSQPTLRKSRKSPQSGR